MVIVNHIRSQETRLHEILPRHTSMPVVLITEKLVILPNHVYIIPAARDLHLLDGAFELRPMSKLEGWPDVITIFLRSLAKGWSGQLIAVIVSGYDGDGAEGLSDVQEAGGITMAQLPDSAQHCDMPVSAIESGHVNFILTPEGIARKIIEIAQSGRTQSWSSES